MKAFVFLLVYIFSGVVFAQTHVPQSIQLAPDEVAVIGYGSLMSQASMTSTLGRDYHGPVVPIEIIGFRRLYNVAMRNKTFFEIENNHKNYPELIAYLNIMPTQNPSDKVNGTLFVIKKSEIHGFDQRESIYDRTLVNDQLRGVSIDGPVYVYVGKKEDLVADGDPRVAVRDTYMKIVENGLSNQSEAFANEYHQTTIPPRHKIIKDYRLSSPLLCEGLF